MILAIRDRLIGMFSKGHERTVLIRKNIIISLILKGLSMGIGFALVPITITYINPTQYGLWLTLSSVIGWINFFDIGLANGLKNKLAESTALGQNQEARIYISTTYAVLGIIGISLFALFCIINPFLNWDSILNFHETADINLSSLALVVVSIFCIQFFVQIINTVLTANHAPSKVSLIAFIGQVIVAAIIYSLSTSTRLPLVYIVGILAGIPLLVQIIASMFYFNFRLSHLKPSLKLVKFKYANNLLKVGSMFFLIQIGALILLQTDNILIIRLFGAKEVTTFNIAFKLYSLITFLFSIVITPFWSAFTDAYTKGDFEWIESVLSKMQKYWLGFAACTSVMFFCAPFIYKIWLHNSVALPQSLSLVMVIWVLAYTWQTMYVYFLNGVGKIKLQLYLIVATSILNIPLAIFLSKFIGLAGITLSNAIVFIFLGIAYYIQTKMILKNKATGIFNK